MPFKTLFVENDPVAEKQRKRLTIAKRIAIALVAIAAVAAVAIFLVYPFFKL